MFATRTEGVRGNQAVEWGLVDAIAPRTKFEEESKNRALARAEASDRPADAKGIELTELERTIDGDEIRYPNVEVRLDRELGTAWFTLKGPSAKSVPGTPDDRQPSMLSRVKLPDASRYMSRDAFSGARSRKSMNVDRPSASRISM